MQRKSNDHIRENFADFPSLKSGDSSADVGWRDLRAYIIAFCYYVSGQICGNLAIGVIKTGFDADSQAASQAAQHACRLGWRSRPRGSKADGANRWLYLFGGSCWARVAGLSDSISMSAARALLGPKRSGSSELSGSLSSYVRKIACVHLDEAAIACNSELSLASDH